MFWKYRKKTFKVCNNTVEAFITINLEGFAGLLISKLAKIISVNIGENFIEGNKFIHFEGYFITIVKILFKNLLN